MVFGVQYGGKAIVTEHRVGRAWSVLVVIRHPCGQSVGNRNESILRDNHRLILGSSGDNHQLVNHSQLINIGGNH